VSLELENLLSLHDDVQEAAVIGVPDERWGERPLAIIVPKVGSEHRITAQVMQAHLQASVDDGTLVGWAVPDHYMFSRELPRTSVGKIDKKALREIHGQAVD
jgi:fatty-acyl-CoA synthase